MAILTALAVEESAIIEAIGNCEVHRWREQSLHVGTVAGLTVLVVPIGVGTTGAAAATERVIGIWNPALIMLVGIAAGAQGSSADMRPGDILVPDQVVGYERAKVTPGDTLRHFEVYRPDARLLVLARSLQATDWADGLAQPGPDDHDGPCLPTSLLRRRPVVHVGPILTGDKVLADATALADLRLAWPKAIGVEMESLGVALAAYHNGSGFLMIKAVSDFADGAKNDDWHRYAASAAARFAAAVLARAACAAAVLARRDDPPEPPVAPLIAVGQHPGRVKIEFCQRLGSDWEDVADIFDVPVHVRARFRPGQQPRDLWEWLQARMKLYALPAAVAEVGRPELADLLLSAEP